MGMGQRARQEGRLCAERGARGGAQSHETEIKTRAEINSRFPKWLGQRGAPLLNCFFGDFLSVKVNGLHVIGRFSFEASVLRMKWA